MRVLRIQEILRTGLHDNAQIQFIKQLTKPQQVGRLDRKRVAVVIVEGERDAAVSAIGDDFKRIFQLVMRKSIRVVAETQIHLACPTELPGAIDAKLA